MKKNVVGDGDVLIGTAIRRLRHKLGLSQEQLAADLGVTYQQVQKYEQGLNRISAVRLVAVANALSCSVTDLLIDLPLPARSANRLRSLSSQALLLADAFEGIADPKQRQCLLQLAVDMSSMLGEKLH